MQKIKYITSYLALSLLTTLFVNASSPCPNMAGMSAGIGPSACTISSNSSYYYNPFVLIEAHCNVPMGKSTCKLVDKQMDKVLYIFFGPTCDNRLFMEKHTEINGITFKAPDVVSCPNDSDSSND